MSNADKWLNKAFELKRIIEHQRDVLENISQDLPLLKLDLSKEHIAKLNSWAQQIEATEKLYNNFMDNNLKEIVSMASKKKAA